MWDFDAFGLNAVVDRLPDCVLIVDADGVVTAASAASRLLLGVDPEALVGMHVEALVPGAARQHHVSMREAYGRDPETRRMGADRLVSAQRGDGEQIDVEVWLSPLDPDGSHTLVVVRGTSIQAARHARMQAQIELMAAMARGASTDVTLQVAVERACHAVRADAGWLWLRNADDRLSLVAGADHGHEVVEGLTIDVVLDAIAGHDGVTVLDAATPGHPLDGFTALGYGPIVVAPIGHDHVRGLLVLARRSGRQPFEPAHRTAADEFAAIVVVALDLASSRTALDHLAVVDDRDRIAREMHDSTVQRLYADGLRLGKVVRSCPPEAAAEIRTVMQDLEASIAELRSAIFAMNRMPPGVPLAEVMRSMIDDFAAPGTLSSSLQVDDGLDDRISTALRHHALAALRECLANVVRHANASRVVVSVGLHDGELVVAVADDGIGPPDVATVHGNGLLNLTARAVALGGRFELERSEPAGAVAIWAVPVEPPGDGARR